MNQYLDKLIVAAIARKGSVSEVERYGFTAVQISSAIRKLLIDGALVRQGSKFVLAPGILPAETRKRHPVKLEPLNEFAIEKMSKTDQYVIGHRTFAQIRAKVRP